MIKRFQKWLLSLVRNRMEKNNEDGTFDKSLAAMDEAYGNLDSSSADAFSDFSDKVQSGWEGFTKGIRNWWRGFTGSGLTDRDIALNEMNMQNVEDTSSKQVAGYQKAGVNPALMFSGGASNSAPQTTSTGGSGSLSDLMQVFMLPRQLKMMDAQTRNINAQSEKTMADTEQVKLAIQYYPTLTEKTIAEVASRTDLNVQNLSIAKVQEEIAGFEKIIKKSESEYADQFYDLRNQYQAAQRDSALESAAESAARAAWTEFETQWTKDHNGARPSSSSLLALIEALSSMFGVSGEHQQGIITRAVTKVVDTKPQMFYNDPQAFEKNKHKPFPRLYMRARRAIRGRGLVLD